ncbi:MAG TPA: ATP-binding protein [Bacteroidales bacterium]
MILELKIRNFLSFKDEVTFSFEATSDDTLNEYYIAEPVPGVRILKMAMVYGANASGKSNLLHAFNFIRSFVQNIPKERDKSTRFVPFRFDVTNNQPGSFELIFFTEGVKHKYQLEIDSEKVLKEVLYYYPGTQPAAIFDRYFDESKQVSIVAFGPKIKISEQAKEAVQLKTLKNMSVLAAYAQVNLALPELNRPAEWLKNQIMPTIDPYTSLTKYSDRHIKSDDRIKKLALDFIKEADFNISDISFEEELENVPDDMLKMLENGPFPEEAKAKLLKERAIHVEKTIFEHRILKEGKEELHKLPETLESQGTLRYYGLSAPFFNATDKDAFLSIDEIGSALHPLLVMHFLREFLRKSKNAQLLFTTHNLSLLLEKEILRKDAIWFTEKGKDGATSVYSMADFNFRKELSFYNAYKQGKFGAIPNLED